MVALFKRTTGISFTCISGVVFYISSGMSIFVQLVKISPTVIGASPIKREPRMGGSSILGTRIDCDGFSSGISKRVNSSTKGCVVGWMGESSNQVRPDERFGIWLSWGFSVPSVI